MTLKHKSVWLSAVSVLHMHVCDLLCAHSVCMSVWFPTEHMAVWVMSLCWLWLCAGLSDIDNANGKTLL